MHLHEARWSRLGVRTPHAVAPATTHATGRNYPLHATRPRGGQLAHQRRAPAFASASGRRRARASNARCGRDAGARRHAVSIPSLLHLPECKRAAAPHTSGVATTTTSACLLHGLLPASPGGLLEVPHAPVSVGEQNSRPRLLLFGKRASAEDHLRARRRPERACDAEARYMKRGAGRGCTRGLQPRLSCMDSKSGSNERASKATRSRSFGAEAVLWQPTAGLVRSGRWREEN